MAIARVGGSTITFFADQNAVFTDPSTGANQVAIVGLTSDGNNGWTPPTGFTAISDSAGPVFSTCDGQVFELFQGLLQGVGGSVTFTSSDISGNEACGFIEVYSGVNSVTPLNTALGELLQASCVTIGGSVASSSISPTVANCMLVTVVSLDIDESFSVTYTAPSGFSVAQQVSSANFASIGCADKLNTGTGPTGSLTWGTNYTATAGSVVWLLALAPSGGGSTKQTNLMLSLLT
jgi:hypothetical protein